MSQVERRFVKVALRPLCAGRDEGKRFGRVRANLRRSPDLAGQLPYSPYLKALADGTLTNRRSSPLDGRNTA